MLPRHDEHVKRQRESVMERMGGIYTEQMYSRLNNEDKNNSQHTSNPLTLRSSCIFHNLLSYKYVARRPGKTQVSTVKLLIVKMGLA